MVAKLRVSFRLLGVIFVQFSCHFVDRSPLLRDDTIHESARIVAHELTRKMLQPGLKISMQQPVKEMLAGFTSHR